MVSRAWSNLQGSSSSEDIQKLEAEFQQVLRANKENIDFDYDASIREAWGNDLSSFSEAYEEGMKFDDEGVPQLPPYPFGNYLFNSLCDLSIDRKSVV